MTLTPLHQISFIAPLLVGTNASYQETYHKTCRCSGADCFGDVLIQSSNQCYLVTQIFSCVPCVMLPIHEVQELIVQVCNICMYVFENMVYGDTKVYNMSWVLQREKKTVWVILRLWTLLCSLVIFFKIHTSLDKFLFLCQTNNKATLKTFYYLSIMLFSYL